MNKDKTNKYNNSIKEKFTKKVFTINSDQPFIDTLAKGINVRYENQLEKANVRILLPNRRSVRALKDSLISLSKNKACIIPKIIALGDLDYNDFESIDHSNNLEELFYNQALPPINELERQFLLTKLVSKWNELDSYHSISLKEQTKLALDLGRLIDQFQYYGISIDRLKKIIPKDLSEHWQTNLKFLNIILVSWPKILNELKKDDIVESRNKLIKSIIKEWEIFPPEYPIIAAGSTGSNKATSDLLMRISMLPRGEVIIPGLDKNLESYSWKNLDENHPQYFIRELLRKFDIDRESVNSWNENNKKNKNNKSIFISEVMRPYISTNQWEKFNLNFNDSNFLTRFECVNQREEAGIISLIIRETIENKNVKIALVTQDRDLGRRVMSEIKRWNIEIDNSSGNSLLSTIEGSLIQLTADLMINNFNSLSLLSALKHPISSCGYDLISYRELINYFDKYIVRELYADKKANIIKLYLKLYSRKKNLNTREGDLFNLFEKINKVVLDFEKLSSQPQVDFSIIFSIHTTLFRLISSSGNVSNEIKDYQRELSEEVEKFIEEINYNSKNIGKIYIKEYSKFINELLSKKYIWSSLRKKTNVFLWGPLEARLQNVDKVIFGGMNEGSWPPKNHLNPWLTRHMSKQVGLPMPEYRIGLSAHDFVQCFSSSKEIIITRSKKIDGNETVKSRWFERINTLIGEPTGNELERISKINFFYKSLDSPFKIKKINPPFVCPPALVRPTNFSVSDIETIMHNPYAIYVKKILNIKPLREVNFTPDVKERGSFIHKALEKYIKNYIKINKEHNIGELDSIGMNLLGRKLKNPIVKIFWVPLFKRISKLFILLDDQKESFYEIFSEEKGQIEINNGSDIFILRAKADRLQKNKNNKIEVIDYKTGLIPKWSDVEFGIKPQLALESLIVERGGFESIGIKKVDNIHYWKLSDSNDQGIHSYNNSDQSINKLISNTEEGLLLLLENFKRSDIPYLAYPLNSPDTYDEFEQISRFKEWAGMFSINNKL